MHGRAVNISQCQEFCVFNRYLQLADLRGIALSREAWLKPVVRGARDGKALTDLFPCYLCSHLG